MSITISVYKLPTDLRKQVLLDCYNALRQRGKTHEQAKHEVSTMVVCSRLCDLECFVDVFKYRL